METYAGIPSTEVSLSLPVSAAVRSTLIEQVLDTLTFTLQQVPATLSQLRKWDADLQKAESEYTLARGRPPPRGLPRRRALTYLQRYEGLISGVRSLCACSYVTSALVLLGPNIHNPKFALWINFDSGFAQDRNGLPVKQPRIPSTGHSQSHAFDEHARGIQRHGSPDGEDDMDIDMDVEQDESEGEGRGRRGESTAAPAMDASVCPTGVASGSTRILCKSIADYVETLSTATASAVAKKVARVLIAESVKLCGLSCIGPTKIHILLYAGPLPSHTASSTSTSAFSSDSRSSTERDGEAVAFQGWQARPSFQLKAPWRILRLPPKRAKTAAALLAKAGGTSSTMTLPPGLVRGEECYRLCSMAVSQEKNTGISPGMEGMVFPEAEFCWYQWAAAPTGFKGQLPRPPKVPAPSAMLSQDNFLEKAQCLAHADLEKA